MGRDRIVSGRPLDLEQREGDPGASRLGPPTSRWEAEADRVAEEAVARPWSRAGSGGAAEPPREREGSAGRPGLQSRPSAPLHLGRPGEPLRRSVRRAMETKLGHDFRKVRIHAHDEAARSAEELGARAYTNGQDIVFGAGEYRPQSREGRRLLAHELAHVAQRQSTTGGPSGIQLQSISERARAGSRRARERAGRYRRRAEERARELRDRAGEARERAGRAAELAEEELADWRREGTGAVQRMDFDGREVRLSGATTYRAPAVSGLKPGHPRIREAGLPPDTDCTRPQYQDLADIGPIPEGSYRLSPSDVERSPPARFPGGVGVWGRYRTRLRETIATNVRRRAATERTGGFFLHRDANNRGTAGCIGLESATDNRRIHQLIEENEHRIPVVVSYS